MTTTIQHISLNKQLSIFTLMISISLTTPFKEMLDDENQRRKFRTKYSPSWKNCGIPRISFWSMVQSRMIVWLLPFYTSFPSLCFEYWKWWCEGLLSFLCVFSYHFWKFWKLNKSQLSKNCLKSRNPGLPNVDFSHIQFWQ